MAMIKQKTIIIWLLILVGVYTACWNNQPTTRIGNINPISMLTNSSVNVLSVTTTFTSNLSTLTNLKTGLGLIGYQSYLTNTFSFNTTVGNVGLTSISVIVQPKDNTYLVNIKLRYLITQLTIPKMDLLMACFKCMSISLGSGDRSQIFSSQIATSMANTTTLKVRSFFYAFNFTNLVGTKNYLQVNSVNNVANYLHTVTTSDNTTVDFVCLTTLVWETLNQIPGAGLATVFETYDINSTIQTSKIKYYASFDCNDLGFFGLSMIHHTMGGERLFIIFPQNYILTNSSFTFNSYFIGATLEVIYIGALNSSNTSSVYDPVTQSSVANCTVNITANESYICVPCAPQCKTCISTNSTQCISCNFNTTRSGISCSCISGYYQVNKTSACIMCNSSLSYCSICSNNSYCLTCSATSPFNISGKCYCSNTNYSYLVNGTCLSYPGCIGAQYATNTNYCETCDGTKGFQLDSVVNKTCRCKPGLNNTIDPNICKTICGNGNVTGKACDDNDTINNNGCTNCTVDAGYYCYVAANTNGPSICITVSSSSITYLYAERIAGTNQAKLYFSVYPAGLAIPSSTFRGHVSSNASYDLLTATYDQSSSRITVTIQFTKDMEGNNYYFTFNYSALTTFYSSPITVNVTTKGINQQLILLSLNVVIKTMKYVVIGISVIGILIALISTITGYKLMGLQLILPLQAIYFTQLTMQNPPPYIQELTSLSYANGFNKLFTYDYYNYYLQNSKLPKFLYSVEYGVNVNVMVGFLLISTLILIILQLVYLCHNAKTKSLHSEQEQQVKTNKKNSKQKKEDLPPEVKLQDEQLLSKQKLARERRNTYLNHFYFTVAMIMVQQVIFSFITDNSQLKVGAEILGGDINLLLSYISMILIVPNLIYLFDQYTHKKEKRALTFPETGRYKYPVLLVFSYVLLAVVIALTFTYTFALYAALAVSVLPLIILIKMKPYQKSPFTICIVSAVADQIMLIAAVAVYLANSIITLSQFGWLISVAVIVVLIAISQGLTIVRMVKVIPWKEFELFQRCLKKDKTRQKAGKGKAEKQKLLDRKPEIQMTEQIKNSLITGGENKMLDWEQHNSKEYNSIKSGKANKQDDQHENSQESEEDQLLILKRRLKKQINSKRTKI